LAIVYKIGASWIKVIRMSSVLSYHQMCGGLNVDGQQNQTKLNQPTFPF
jgi:hypothetical protein